jgi:hypothetical protein
MSSTRREVIVRFAVESDENPGPLGERLLGLVRWTAGGKIAATDWRIELQDESGQYHAYRAKKEPTADDYDGTPGME